MGSLLMKRKTLPRLYLITDGLQRGNKQEEALLLTKIEAALAGGVRLLQLREKNLEGGDLLRLAKKIRTITTDYGASLLINERVDIALASLADGVHLTASSFSPTEARRLLGKDSIIGVSTHSAEQAQRGENKGADFITLGPVYHTPSKAAYGDPLGIDSFKEISSKIKIPVFALGGVKKDNTKDVIGAGAYGTAMISEVIAAADITKTTQEILTNLDS